MLSFFRKYQKILFIFVTIIIVTTFVFFGTYQVLSPSFRSKEEEAFNTVDKKKVTVQYFQAFTHFLGSTPLTMKGGGYNFLSDAFVIKEILESGAYAVLVEKLFKNEKFQEEQQRCCAKEKLFKPYTNPYNPMLSVENIWALFAPEVKERLQELRGQNEFSVDSFKAKVNLFLAERKFPPELLAYVLHYQVKENPNLPVDPRLTAENLALFHYHTLGDWFGQTFMEECAKVILQGAARARALGHSVTQAEVMADICFRKEKAFEHNPQVKQHFHTVENYYTHCLQMTGINEPMVLAMTEELLLFRRLFDGVSNAFIADDYSLHRFYDRVNLYAEVELYHLPKEYVPSSEEEVKKLESYYQKVVASREDPLDIPEKIDPLELIEKRAPELISTTFDVMVQEINVEELLAKISLKETWDWEKAHLDLLKSHFPQLEKGALDEVKREERRLMDAFAREAIAKSHPEWIIDGLKEKKAKPMKLTFGKEEEGLAGISDKAALLALLESQESPTAYTQDERHFYTLTLATKTPEKRVLTYSEALGQGILNDNVASADYEKVISSLHGEWGKRGFSLLEKARKASQLPSLVVKKEEKIFAEGGTISFEEAIQVKEGEYSAVHYSPAVGCYYFKNLGVRRDTTLPLDKLLEEQQMIANEIKCHLFRELYSLWIPSKIL